MGRRDFSRQKTAATNASDFGAFPEIFFYDLHEFKKLLFWQAVIFKNN
jgi:hypothetical protein